jgi:hypothetical protein
MRSEKYYKTIFSKRPYFGLYSELKEKTVTIWGIKFRNGARMPATNYHPHAAGMIGN